ncbi:cytosine permease [Neokomagataea thailandica]|uniref:APC transporter NCS1 n=1 Tax=Neokomagataea tanensis NBRC 106556 TaxID=1223519 RepID=A0ABQ0QI29_9PROT|nr:MULTISPECIES: cytosine permease [Neokomagataea]GBR45575.1 APC transporter NCS1 [Neokomagataea tanensis NBRC 106556]
MNQPQPSYHNDLSPIETQDWGWFDYLSFWMSDIHSIGGYILAGTLFGLGLPPVQILTALITGSLIVCLFCTLIAVPSQRFGVPFSVIIRASFGPYAAAIPAAIRAFIAMAWYGIQTWLASNAMAVPLLRLFPCLTPFSNTQHYSFLGLSYLGWGCFLVLWGAQMLLFRKGISTIRRFFDFAGPAVYIVMVFLLIDLLHMNHWHWPHTPHSTYHGGLVPWLSATALVVSYFSGPMLNFGDFARNGRTMGHIRIGNMFGLPVNFIAFALLAVATTTLTQPVFGTEMDDPVAIVAHLDNPAALALAIITFLLATTGINIAANFVSGALDLCAIAPKMLNWKRAGWLCGIGAILITPWNLYNNPTHMHLTLDTLAAAVGPLFGIVMTDYFIRRRTSLSSAELTLNTPYDSYAASAALSATLLGALIAMAPEGVASIGFLSNFSWFLGALSGSIIYIILSPKYANA